LAVLGIAAPPRRPPRLTPSWYTIGAGTPVTRIVLGRQAFDRKGAFGPTPTTSTSKSLRTRANRAAASTNTGRPFSATRRPTNTNRTGRSRPGRDGGRRTATGGCA